FTSNSAIFGPTPGSEEIEANNGSRTAGRMAGKMRRAGGGWQGRIGADAVARRMLPGKLQRRGFFRKNRFPPFGAMFYRGSSLRHGSGRSQAGRSYTVKWCMVFRQTDPDFGSRLLAPAMR